MEWNFQSKTSCILNILLRQISDIYHYAHYTTIVGRQSTCMAIRDYLSATLD